MQSHWKPFYCTEDPSRNKTDNNVGDSSERTNKVEEREEPYVPRARRCHPTPPHQHFRPVPMGNTADLERLRAGTPAPQAAWADTLATAPPQPQPQETFDSDLFHPRLTHRYHGTVAHVPQQLPVEPASDPRRLPRQPSEPPASRATEQCIKRRRN